MKTASKETKKNVVFIFLQSKRKNNSPYGRQVALAIAIGGISPGLRGTSPSFFSLVPLLLFFWIAASVPVCTAILVDRSATKWA